MCPGVIERPPQISTESVYYTICLNWDHKNRISQTHCTKFKNIFGKWHWFNHKITQNVYRFLM